ncbi:MAG: phage holin family protein [Candidatus Hydrogenedentes bacterium]|nr:phage holin family protein [Candidatus Hydrogenedentota bacterium]
MQTLSEFVVRLADLAEAEGRLAQRKTVQVIQAAVLWWAAAVLSVSGVLLLTAALYFLLRLGLSQWLSFLLIALVPLVLGGACAVMGRKAMKGG